MRLKNSFRKLPVFSLIFLAAGAVAWADPISVPKPGETLATPVKLDNLDPEAFAEWMDGKEVKIEGAAADRSPQNFLWTTKGKVGTSVLIFGDSKTPGPRHLRIGFRKAVPIGTVLTLDGGTLSVLKSGARYPGDLANESDWIAGQRMGAKFPGINQFALWSFPPGTETRAFRVTRISEATDNQYAGKLQGIFVFENRWSNLAPSADFTASLNSAQADRLKDFSKNTFWENLNKEDDISSKSVISAGNSEWILMTWPKPVTISGLVALQAGFTSAEVQMYTGPAEKHPREATEADWKSLGSYGQIENGGSVGVWPNLLDFGHTETTRALRLRLTAPMAQTGVLKEQSRNGYRVALTELMVMHPLGNTVFDPVVAGSVETSLPPPIPIKFNLKEPGFVTLVIEDSNGVRVRNLVSETWFPAGANTAWWDGTNDLARDLEAAKRGLYSIPPQPVAPGEYRVRGLARKAIIPRFEFSIYTAGNPAWPTADRTGGWLSNHSAPQGAVFVPGNKIPGGKDVVLLGSYVAEGRDGLAWVDLDGKKLGGQTTVGGNWTGAPFLARDEAEKVDSGVVAYAASAWETGKKSNQMELRLTGLALNRDKDKAVIVYPLGDLSADRDKREVSGLAVRDGIAVISLVMKNKLIFVDVEKGSVLGEVAVPKPAGVAFDSQGRLLVLSEKKLLRYASAKLPASAPETIVAEGLEAPIGLALDSKGDIYVGDRGASHQVKVFTAEGKPLRVIGKPGAPKAGPYDPLHMNNPAGLTVDSKMQLWVAETDYLPKRVSVWSPDGKLLKAFYGPAKYGGGGTLDPEDKTKFYYADEGRGAIEFHLDWEKGTSEPSRVYYRSGPDQMKLAFRSGAPETPLYVEKRRYFTNAYNSNPTSGHNTAFIFLDRDGLAKPVAAAGQAKAWEIFDLPEFKVLLPEGFDLEKGKGGKDQVFFVWSDLNGDAQVQPEEIKLAPGPSGGMTVMPDLSFVASRLGTDSAQFTPTGFTPEGVPKYDLAQPKVVLKGVQGPGSSGGDQVLTGEDGTAIATLGAEPFHRYSVSGGKNGAATWSYPSLWPGLHAGHESPVPDLPGEMTATTRLLGGFVSQKGSDAGKLWALNSDQGKVYLFTSDGLFVATIFVDTRIGKKFTMPIAERGMNLSDVTLHGENFWPMISQTSDGNVYLVDGGRTSLIRLDGLESLHRLPDQKLTVTAEDLKKSQDWLATVESNRQKDKGTGILKAVLNPDAPVVDGKLNEWKGSTWVEVDQRGVKAYFNSGSRPFDVTAAVMVSGDRLYAAWQTGNPKLLENTGTQPQAPFKTGGALDLMIGTDPSAAAGRAGPVPGDLRLLVTVVNGKPLALIYRAVVPGTRDADKVPFSSPWRTITFDKVEDVSPEVECAGTDGNYEISIPLKTLGLAPSDGMRIKGDIGILRGDGIQTSARVYWNNKATALVEDVPAEAMLTPGMWGIFQFEKPAQKK